MRGKALGLAIVLASGCGSTAVPSDGGGGDFAGGGGGDGGGCAPGCGGLTPICNQARHCVGCARDTDCPLGSMCAIVSDTQAHCAAGCTDDTRCPAGDKCCDKACTDPATDPQNCGACGMACAAAHAAATCQAQKCSAAACEAGWGDCDKMAANGCEANLRVDSANCSGCGMGCALPNAVQACADGCYIAACQFGFDDCDGNDQNGCETPVLTDPANCGGCGTACANLPNASASCTDGSCVLGTCTAGFADCNGMANDGCEADLNYDANNCGQCGNVCPQNAPACDQGTCGTVVIRNYTDAFAMGPITGTQCTDWETWRASLVGAFTMITLKGSNDQTGISCTGAAANQICQALHNSQTVTVACNNHMWSVDGCCIGSDIEVSVDGACSCGAMYAARPCINKCNGTTGDWGGIKGTTCSAPAQTITVICQ